jgi:hypothetical protein
VRCTIFPHFSSFTALISVRFQNAFRCKLGIKLGVKSCGICGGHRGTEAGFSSSTSVSPANPHSTDCFTFINRPNSGRRINWTLSNPTPPKMSHPNYSSNLYQTRFPIKLVLTDIIHSSTQTMARSYRLLIVIRLLNVPYLKCRFRYRRMRRGFMNYGINFKFEERNGRGLF